MHITYIYAVDVSTCTSTAVAVVIHV